MYINGTIMQCNLLEIKSSYLILCYLINTYYVICFVSMLVHTYGIRSNNSIYEVALSIIFLYLRHPPSIRAVCVSLIYIPSL